MAKKIIFVYKQNGQNGKFLFATFIARLACLPTYVYNMDRSQAVGRFVKQAVGLLFYFFLFFRFRLYYVNWLFATQPKCTSSFRIATTTTTTVQNKNVEENDEEKQNRTNTHTQNLSILLV